MAKILGRLKSVWPDRTQYKPYAYNLELSNVCVEIEVPDDDIKKGEDNDIILNLHGFSILLGNIADSLDEIHESYTEREKQKQKEKNQNYMRN